MNFLKESTSLLVISYVIYIIIEECNSQLSLPFISVDSGYLITFEIGNPSLTLNQIIDQSLPYSLLYSEEHSNTRSTSKEIIEDGLTIELSQDKIILHFTDSSTCTIPKFEYYFLKDYNDIKSNFFPYGLSLAYSFYNKEMSLIDHLYNQQVISYKLYAFQANKDALFGTLYLGEVPDTLKTLYPYSNMFNIEENHTSWGWTVKQVKFGNSNYNISYSNNYVYVNSGYPNISIPDTYFKKYCDYLSSVSLCNQYVHENFTDVSCSKYIINSLSNITFYFDYNNIMTFKLSSFFKCNDSKCTSLIISHRNSNDWMLGTIFLDNFLSIFDYERKTVSLLSKEKYRIDSVYSRNTIVKHIVLCNGIVLFIYCVVLFIFSKIKNIK